jgi:protein-L-isoaspartate(D-aspartate) O-methyltransferase
VHGLQRDGQEVKTFPGLPAIDRRLFLPDEIIVSVEVPFERWTPHLQETKDPNSKLHEHVRISRSDDPEAWERWVDSDAAITTRVKGEGDWPSSSSSAPWLMARMIEALDLVPGMRVLEIGTGTGFNAACLAALGADVVSVEIQKDVAEQARANLKSAGYPAQVVTGNGALGVPEEAPYDRVIATAAVHTVPYAWVEQTRDGGLLVVPYTGEFHREALLVLTVAAGVATGGMVGTASFMPLKGQGLSPVQQLEIKNRVGLRIEVAPQGQQITYATSSA